MTQEFDSPSLSLITQQHGLSGVDATQQTFLDDENVSQILDIIGSSRRASPEVPNAKMHGVLANFHAVASELQSFVDPYNPVNPQNGYPAPVDPNKFDIWLLGLSCRVAAGDGASVTWGMATADSQTDQQMFSDTATGGAVTPADRETALAAWTIFTGLDAVSGDFARDLAGRTFTPMKMRWPPNTLLSHRSQVTASTTVFQISHWAIFPIGLGQDAF